MTPAETLEDLQRLAMNSPTVASYLQLWQRGACTWDVMLRLLAVELARHNAVMLGMAMRNWQLQPPAPIVLQTRCPHCGGQLYDGPLDLPGKPETST